MSSIKAPSIDFRYQLLPSAFRVAEYPTYYCWKSLKSSEVLWKRETATDCERLKNRTFAVLRGCGSFLGGLVALPITLCTAPLTLLADVIIGVVECIFCAYQGLKKEDILLIAHRKFIVSPCQHLAFCVGAIVALGLSSALIAPIFWSLGYASGQAFVGALPTKLNHHTFNIFVEGGSGEGQDETEKWLDGCFRDMPQSDPAVGVEAKLTLEGWCAFIARESASLGHIDDAGLNPTYLGFKSGVMRKCKPQELLQLPDNFSQEDLVKKYRQLALILHPDKNLPRQNESKALFLVLRQAFCFLGRT